MTRRGSALLAAVLVLGVAAAPRSAAPLPVAPVPSGREPGVVSFLAFGDGGTARAGQKHVAAAMRSVLAKSPVDFALVLGDSFYPHGLSGPDDPLFDRAFASVYPVSSFSFPFYAVAGNHDEGRGAAALLGLAARDARWRMPAASYAFRAPLGAGASILFVALDTTPFDARDGARAAEIVRRAEGTLAGAPDAWRIAFGHHPVRSSGMHDATREMRARLAPLVEGGEIDLYLAGHEHFLEALEPPGGPAEVISGGASGWDEASPITRQRPESAFRLTGGGFVRVEVRKDAAVVVFFDGDGESRHTMRVAARRARPAAPHTPPRVSARD